MSNVRRMRGFTLLEVIIYLALFSILLGGAVICSFNLFTAAAYGGTRTLLTEESAFMLGKIEQSLSEDVQITEPRSSENADVLRILKAGSQQTYSLSGTDLVVAEGATPQVVLNASNVTVAKLRFQHAPSGASETLVTVLTLTARSENGMVFTHVATSTVFIR
ncbi:MAG: hypothetical protein JWL82_624 [Parcubacteria group bacterium]|nr:hypothetical protein [Parcubacteria group bacterium]